MPRRDLELSSGAASANVGGASWLAPRAGITEHSPMQRPLQIVAALGAVLSLTAAAAGMLFLQDFEATPGATTQPPTRWPSESRLIPTEGRANLVIALHPHCPCSRATLTELGRLIAEHPTDVSTHILFLKPSNFPDGWEQSDLWNAAALIPGAQLIPDLDGVEAHRFGALTSGQVLLYDSQGALQFSGGITKARGIAGDNTGERAVAKIISGQSDVSQTCVYGCPLFDASK
jgi:hypothetical protein